MSPMRSPRGMGPLHKKGHGPTARWSFWLDGRRITTPYAAKGPAEAWRRKYLAGLAAGETTAGSESATVSDLLDLVEQDYERHNKKSIEALRSRIKRLRAELGKLRAVHLNERHVAGYRDARQAAPATVNRELEVLRRALRLGQRRKLLAAPIHVEMLRERNVRTQRISHQQYLILIDALRAPEKWAAIIGYHTGWRLGRILDLTWDRVDWARLVLRPPERQEEQKRVGAAPIYGGMVDALAACRRRADETGSSYVVHRLDGRPLVDIRKAWQAATKAAKLPGFRFHDLRACAASNLIDAGVPQVEAMRILGHQTASMFQRYQIDSPRRLQEIGQRLEAFLAPAASQSPKKPN